MRIPPGGVKQGQKIQVPFLPASYSSEFSPLIASSSASAPGIWKDSLCDCCKYSPLHPSFLNACCCPQLLMAQVLTRMNMNYIGNHVSEWEAKLTFRQILGITVIYYALSAILAPPGPMVGSDGTWTVPEIPLWQHVLYNSLTSAFALYTLVVMVKVRSAVRAKYEIPVTRCVNQPIIEDCCCSFWCGCCTVAQLARQTASYDVRRAVCCSIDGLPPTTVIHALVV